MTRKYIVLMKEKSTAQVKSEKLMFVAFAQAKYGLNSEQLVVFGLPSQLRSLLPEGTERCSSSQRAPHNLETNNDAHNIEILKFK